MIKHLPKFILTLLAFCCLLNVEAQVTYGNEWINYNQLYYKVKVWNDGVYRIPLSALQAAIPQLDQTDPRNFQIFGRGQEVPLHVQGEDDGTWNEGDFIEFFARRNDGWADTRLYQEPLHQTNRFYSLFTDTAVYYITWNNSTTNLRLSNETDNNFTAFGAASPFHFAEVRSMQTNNYYFGKTDAINSTDPEYDRGEGWSGSTLTAPINNQTTNIATPQAFTGGPPAWFEIYYKSMSNSNVFLDHRYKLEIGGQIIDTLVEGHGSHRFTFSVAANLIGNTTAYKFSYITIPGVAASNSAFSNYTMRYAHNFNLENRAFYRMLLPDNGAFSKSYINFNNFNAGTGTVRIYDVSNGRRITAVQQGVNFNALIPNGGLKECYVVAENQITNINTVTPINYVAAQPGRFNNIAAFDGAQYVMITHRKLWQSAEAYKGYRNARYSTGLFDIDELYDQFYFGIQKHPLAIRQFSNFAINNWSTKPEFLYLIGKSISANLCRTPAQINNFNNCLVPTFGFPSCDNLFTNGLGNTQLWEPALATGRLSAQTPADVNNYLNKLQQYESLTPAMWMKQVMHFGGGQSLTEQQTYQNYLNSYQQKIEDTLFGGTVYKYLKTSSAPIQETQSAMIASYINAGVSLMTFFGHATGSGFDVSIDNPANYNNTDGKYPFLIGNSCLAGDVHQAPGSGFSQSEEFTLIPNRGTIGFIASVALGIPFQLHVYTDTLYKYFGRTYYGQPMGYCMKKTVAAVQTNDPYRKAVCLETTLHGDPTVIMHSQPEPDYFITNSSVTLLPEQVTTEVDSFKVTIKIDNLGRAINSPVNIEVRRNLPSNNLTTTYNKTLPSLYYSETVSFMMPVDILNGVGLNKLNIRVDPLNSIDEMSEVNNDLVYEFVIQSADLVPVWPKNFAVVPTNTITLKASTGDPFAPVRNYIFELDTTDLFNSPSKINETVAAPGGVVTWTPPVLMPDSAVYFWRVSPQPQSGGNFSWRESSYQYIQGKRGWSQDHFFQFKANQYNQIDYQRPERNFEFVQNAKELICNTYGFPWEPAELWATSYKIDAEVWADAGCSLDPAMYIAVIDSVTLLPWLSPENCWSVGNQFGQFNNTCACKAGNRMANFVFRTNNQTELNAMKNMLTNSIPNGHYVLAYTWIRGNFSAWPSSVFDAFESLGADSIRTLPNDYPYIFFVKKGNPSTKIELIADSANANLQLNVPMFNSWVSGDFTSSLIGPGSQWDTLSWKAKSFDNAADSIRIQLKGIRPNGAEDVLLNSTVSGSQLALQPLVNGQNYPYLKLNAFMRDDSLRTAVQLDRWQVTFQPAPELALNPSQGFYFYKDTLQQGDQTSLAIAIQNISDVPADSVLVNYWIQDADRNNFPIAYPRQKPLLPNEVLYDTVSTSVTPYVNRNLFFVDVNPNFDQPEQFRFNNLASWPFFVKTDQTNPLLDVTFDGVHILNGDIISPTPYVMLQLKDENQFLAMDDTSAFKVFLRKPGDNTLTPIYYQNNEQLIFTPAQLPNNKCKLEWKPRFEIDGKYDLIVRAKDRSNNASGSVEYKVQFEVIIKSSITEVVNWPNPFSSKTHFVFTLTGSEIPDDFRIQIMTISGKVVREIDQSELGPIRIGRNITDFAWNGRDQYGDQLANGIYFYRVFTGIKGQNIDKRETNADQFFHRGMGKMYLMR